MNRIQFLKFTHYFKDFTSCCTMVYNMMNNSPQIISRTTPARRAASRRYSNEFIGGRCGHCSWSSETKIPESCAELAGDNFLRCFPTKIPFGHSICIEVTHLYQLHLCLSNHCTHEKKFIFYKVSRCKNSNSCFDFTLTTLPRNGNNSPVSPILSLMLPPLLYEATVFYLSASRLQHHRYPAEESA